MKKMLITLLVLAMVAPALADVAVTATDEGTGHLKIKIAPTGGAVVRGVALKLTRTAGDAVIDATTDVTATQFNTFIDYAYSNAGYVIGTGHAIANPSAAGVATLPASTFSLCAGYLDQSSTQAGVTVDSFFDIFYDITVDSTIAIALDTLRGGIVGDSLGTVTVQASQLLEAEEEETIVGTPVVTKTTAAPAIATAVNGGRVETFVASGVAGSLGGALEYQFNWGDGSALTWVPAAATYTHVYTYTAAATYNVTVKARLAAAPAVESATSAVVALTTEPVKYTAAGAGRPVGDMYNVWTAWGRPNCWAFKKNCNGDADGLLELSKPVLNKDLNLFKAAYNKTDAQLAAVVILGVPGICADFEKTAELSKRVLNKDLTIIKNYFNDSAASVPECGFANLHYYTN